MSDKLPVSDGAPEDLEVGSGQNRADDPARTAGIVEPHAATSAARGEKPAGKPILEVRDLRMYFPVKSSGIIRRTIGHVQAVDGVSFQLHKGETLGVVGESGCCKSTLARLLMRVQEPARVRFAG